MNGLRSKQPWVKRALLYDKLEGGQVKCKTCERLCVIQPGKTGFCGTRQNLGGELYTIQYGLSSGISVNPIEKKPFYHFWPGSLSMTIGSWSCNYTCPWCQNWHISKFPPDPAKSEFIPPERFVRLVKEYACQSTSISFNEPTLSLEWSIEVFKLAKNEGYSNTFVTNGYMTLEALRMLSEAGLDAINIDVKGDAEAVRRYCSADVERVWRNVREAKRLGMHVEIVNLIIPGVNDDESQLLGLIRRHLQYAGEETPLHFTRYYPAFKFEAPPTPIKTLELAVELAKGEGVKFAYVGNIPGHKFENTYCPGCGRMLIERFGLKLIRAEVKDGICPYCGYKIPIVGEVRRSLF